MEGQLHSLSKIFTERILRIPDYQRGYAWTEKHLKDFWTDLVQLEEGKNHYTGVLTLENVPSDNLRNWKDDEWIINFKGYTPYYIVDGQQRLTTSIILIQSILEYVPGEKPLNFTSSDEIKKKFIFETKEKGISGSYIFGYEQDNPSYEFLKTKIFMERSDDSSSPQETIYTTNLERAKAFFTGKLADMAFEDVECLYRKLTQNFLFNIYSISEDIDVYVAFETMNNRGKPLSHLELLKNRLIYLSTKFDSPEYERTKLRRAINESWKTIYHQLGRNKANPLDDDEFLSTHFLIYNQNAADITDPEQQAFLTPSQFRALKQNYQTYLLEERYTSKSVQAKQLEVEEIHQYVTSLKDSVEIWYQLLNPEDSDFYPTEKELIRRLNRLRIRHVAPLIMVFYLKERSSEKRILLLRSAEKYLFIMSYLNSAYYGYYGRSYHQALEPQAVWLPIGMQGRPGGRDHAILSRIGILSTAFSLNRDEITANEVLKLFEDSINSTAVDDLIKTVIKSFAGTSGFYSWEGLKYFLFEYEQHLKIAGKNYTDKIDWKQFATSDDRDFVTVEHIYPQKPRKDCWKNQFNKYSLENRKVLMNTIGNLLPLSQPKNSSLQNICFEDKKGSLERKVGYKYGSQSEIEVSNLAEWTPKEILMRSLHLLRFLETNWNINLGSTDSKIKLLELGFVIIGEGLSLSELDGSTGKRKLQARRSS